ncbi:hypothetical protein JTE90_000121 [Oedothorax gibbosus]|uniref:CRAL-TRIO domain-containing protein n=1 Tax=Oedothorax gibbosus TaxID=931172 RepID=A0AAV6V078_9ARAC|nr:hypothetical protein JTE90_000121 [Oedothorax gibbosus]
MWWPENTAQIEPMKEISSAMEQQILHQFRNKVSKMLTPAHTDIILLKFLKAQNYDLNKCKSILQETISLRAVHDIDKLVEFYKKPEVLEKYEFVSSMGYAKDGTPICYVASGKADFYGCIASVNGFTLCQYASLVLELDLRRTREQTKKTGQDINEITYILDMDEFSIRTTARQCAIEMAFDLFRMLQDYYPEIWKKTLIVNASSLFYKAFNFFKPILRGSLLQNISVASKETTPELLLKYIDADVLPVFLGGKRVDSKGDPKCREFLKFGGVVPEESYAARRPLLVPTDPGMCSILVRPRSCYNYPLVVKEANSRLLVDMRTEGGSIATTILFREFGSDPNIPDLPPSDAYLNENDERCNVRLVSPCVKLQLHLAQAEGVYCGAPWPGIYIFRFDNTGNWINGRRLIYRLQVIPPKS